MQIISALLSGVIFGIGLIFSGMTNPAKVQNFLDLFGTWDPSLAFVMGGAIAVTMPGFLIIKKLQKPLFASSFSWPTRKDIDQRLLLGASLFGIGWGLGGLCPGPAITSLSFNFSGTFIFVISMLIGMSATKFINLRSTMNNI